jgi:Tol biopolymer transport system component
MNANDGNAVEISPNGHQVAKKTLVSNGSGDLFGATISPNGKELLFVNDASTANALDIARVQ